MRLTVNGKPLNYEDDPEMPLLWYLRDDLRLTGTRFGSDGPVLLLGTTELSLNDVLEVRLPAPGSLVTP